MPFMGAQDADDASRIRSLILGGVRAKLVYVVAKLGIADELAAGPLPIDEVARRTGAQLVALQRVLRALAAEGLFEEVEPRTFAVTSLGRLLAEDEPGSRKYDALLFGEHVDRVLAHISESVRSGRPAAVHAFGRPYFDWLDREPEAATIFNKAMIAGARATLPMLLPLEIWSRATSVVDVGGGNGTILAALLKDHPHLFGTVLDLPHAEVEATRLLAAEGVADRGSFEPGNFFERVPAGADVYLAVQVLHNWSDDDALRILRNVREAADQRGRLLLIEILVADDDPSSAAWADALSLVWLGGTERTEAEWRQLLDHGGFRVDAITPGERVSAIEAQPT
jgi:SAM-dependent methyltransferase